jgi:hypothetical protein
VAILIVALGMAGAAWAQEPAEGEEERAEPVQKLRVLHNPYDIASFYRSSGSNYFGLQGGPDFVSRYPIAGYYRSSQGPSYFGLQGGPDFVSRYPIAGYYRQNPGVNAYGYGAFWTTGYGPRRLGVTVGYRRSIGQNGDLFLFAPTFLAPVGPLAGVFLDR